MLFGSNEMKREGTKKKHQLNLSGLENGRVKSMSSDWIITTAQRRMMKSLMNRWQTYGALPCEYQQFGVQNCSADCG